jgi:hypothetical protein
MKPQTTSLRSTSRFLNQRAPALATFTLLFSIGSILAPAAAHSSSNDFDPICYLRNNPDITKRTWSGTPEAHWFKFGQHENRNQGCNPDPSTFFNANCYLQKNPDVRSWAATPWEHWIRIGQFESRAFSGCNGNPYGSMPMPYNYNDRLKDPSQRPDQVTIESLASAASGKRIMITAYPKKFGGAIGSMKFDGQEFVDQSDHGREMQSASSFNGSGECNNPTEAGSSGDKNVSSSQLLDVELTSDSMKTVSIPAFWLYGSQKKSGACRPSDTVPKNSLSAQTFTKTIKMNYNGDPSVIEYIVKFQNDKSMAIQSGNYETVTGYMPPVFSNLYTVDPASSLITLQNNSFISMSGHGFPNGTQLSSRPHKVFPIIVSDDSQRHALGVLYPKRYQIYKPGANDGHDFYKFPGVTKWNFVVYDSTQGELEREFRLLLVVGNLATVKEKLTGLLKTEGGFDQ